MPGVLKALLYSSIAMVAPYILTATLARAESTLPHLPDDSSAEVTSRLSFVKQDSKFRVPALSPSEARHLLRQYSFIDPLNVVPQSLKAKALAYFHANLSHIANSAYVSIVDFSKPSNEARFFIIDMNSGAVLTLHVAHGKNSDPTNSGMASLFSNRPNSDQSSLGFYLTAETYFGKHGLSLRMDGLSTSNSNVRAREIVLHGANYVLEANVVPGRSWGCLAVAMSERDQVIQLLKGGSLIFAERATQVSTR